MSKFINPLIGNTITEVYLSSDKYLLKIQLEEQPDPVIAWTDADCCSNTWIEGLELPALGFPAKVLGVEDLDLSSKTIDNDPTHDCLQFYGCKVITEKGELVVDYRNSSNGYYGGDLVWPGENSWNDYKPSEDIVWEKVV